MYNITSSKTMIRYTSFVRRLSHSAKRHVRHNAPLNSESKRTASSNIRLSSRHKATRTALAVEASSLRYANLLLNSSDNILPIFCDGIIDQDDDGT